MHGEDPLEDRLRELAARATYPPTPDTSNELQRRLWSRKGSTRTWRRSLLIGVAAVLLIGETAIAGIYGLPGLRVSLGGPPPSPNVSQDPLAIRESLGKRSTVEEARAALGADLLIPRSLGLPDEVYLGNTKVGGVRAALVYVANGTRKPMSGDIALIVTEWRGVLDEGFATKWLPQEGGYVETVAVGRENGYWFSGTPHVFQYLDEINGIRRDVFRLVGDVLVWQHGQVIYRIESPIGREATIKLGEEIEASKP